MLYIQIHLNVTMNCVGSSLVQTFFSHGYFTRRINISFATYHGKKNLYVYLYVVEYIHLVSCPVKECGLNGFVTFFIGTVFTS